MRRRPAENRNGETNSMCSTGHNDSKKCELTERYRSPPISPNPHEAAKSSRVRRRVPPGVSLAELEKMYRRECPGKSRDMLQVAVLRATMRRGRTATPQGARRAPYTGGSVG